MRPNSEGCEVKWRVSSPGPAKWDVTAPGGRTWTSLPSQAAAFNLAQSLAAVETMLRSIQRPQLIILGQPRRASTKYGCYPMPAKARR